MKSPDDLLELMRKLWIEKTTIPPHLAESVFHFEPNELQWRLVVRDEDGLLFYDQSFFVKPNNLFLGDQKVTDFFLKQAADVFSKIESQWQARCAELVSPDCIVTSR